MRLGRAVGATAAALGLLLWTSTSPTLGGWSSGILLNQINSGAPASLVFTHSAGPCSLGPRVSGSVSCPGTPTPLAASAATSVTGIDTLTDNGTVPASGLSRSVSAASCATVQLANRASAANVMLPRYNTAFQTADPWSGTNAISLDGSSYAAAVVQQTQPNALLSSYGLGIWFKASSGQSGPLFSMDTAPTSASTANGDDRTLYLKPNGTLTYVLAKTGISLSTTATFADGAWHFAYVSIANLAASSLTTLYVDATNVASVSLGAGVFTSVTGYWHLGWGSTALTGLSSGFFTGSLSNFVVFNRGTAPTPPTRLDLASQASFTAWAATATEHWLLGDPGTTTYTGPQPVIGTSSPCTMLTISWTFTNPAAVAVTAALLSAFATGTPYDVGAVPGPGGVQTGTITISRAGTYDAYVSGLRLYLPLTDTVQTSAGKWPLTFTWTSSAAVVLA